MSNDPVAATVVPCPSPFTDLTPSQQLALFQMRHCELSERVRAKLSGPGSTVRAGGADYRTLVEMRLAVRKPNGFHRLTHYGDAVSTILLRECAKLLGIKAPMYRPARGSGFQRSIYVGQSTW